MFPKNVTCIYIYLKAETTLHFGQHNVNDLLFQEFGGQTSRGLFA